jgi:hypothetical protein
MRTVLAATVALLLAGCVTTGSSRSTLSGPNRSMPSFWGSFAASTAGMRESWKRLTEANKAATVVGWDWSSMVPTAAPAANAFPAVVPRQAVAYYCPSLRGDGILLASTHTWESAFSIVNVGGRHVQNCADLYVAVERAIELSQRPQVDLCCANDPEGSPEVAVHVDRRALIGLTLAAHQNQPVLRIVEDGHFALVIMDGVIRAKLTARLERRRRLLQVVLSMVNLGDREEILPLDLRASCNDQPLRCLSVAETLELLYGSLPKESQGEQAYSLAGSSQREDFLIPANYKRLQTQLANEAEKSHVRTGGPALASLPGHSYPGPALLGDARALGAFLLQRQTLRPGDPQRTGWVMFAVPASNEARTFDVQLDLGQGIKHYSFLLPHD